MGSCIGKRNLKYFLAFLCLTSLHALTTLGITLGLYISETMYIDEWDFSRRNERNYGLLSMAVGLYAGIIGLTLFCFSSYSLGLLKDNITSNENIRTRWHAKRARNQKRRYTRLSKKPNEMMTPEELTEWTEIQQDT